MITPFDAFLLVGILTAMLLSSEPKKSAIAVVLYISLLGTALDHFFDGWIVMNMASIIESLGAILLLSYARTLQHQKERSFFRLMSAFMLMSAATVPLYTYDIIVLPGDYIYLSHAIAMAHLTFMVTFSDGFRIVARNMRDYLFNHRGHSASS